MRFQTTIVFFFITTFLWAQNDTTYWRNGRVESVKIIEADSCIIYNYYESGQLKQINISVDGPLLISIEEICQNGQLKKKYNPNSEAPALVKAYSCDGSLSMEYYRCRQGYRGLFKVYHKNGLLAERGSYEQTDSPIGEQKVGLWVSYTPEGKRIYEALYENGVMVSEKRFN